MTKLKDLNARFYDYGAKGERSGVGVMFDCPCGSCDSTRLLAIPFKNPLDGKPHPSPEGAMWSRQGETIDSLTLSPSVRRLEGCKWHGWIRNGEAVSC